ncbi:hypothetical protein LWI29_016208 [Acer saccharum]|uniref:GDSL esterase/lipase n=1 Tax=Acer saccharum TaxID=4024 RepID=A0AA39RVG3_ACESA|nr:hypothetical protein LWI29_016208 [Acer saccharum]
MPLLLVLLFLCCISLFISGAQALNNNTISAIYVFGDSTVDPGNNNYINTVMRADFSPYGRDFVNQMPTGRFTNGRLTTDFLGQYCTDLQEEGARKIVVTGLPPMGCLPAVITLNSEDAILQRGCIDKYSTVAREYNQMLQNELKSMHFGSANNIDAKIYYFDIYGPMIDMIQGPAKLGFDEVNNGCCGTGYVEAGLLCNPKSYVCPDASKYVFWDSIHPTEKTYNNIFKACLNILDDFIKD